MSRKKERTKRRGRPRYLASLSADQLMGEIARRRDVLQAARSEFEAALANVNAELAQFDDVATGGATSKRRGPGRPRGTGAPPAKRRGRGAPGRGRGGNEKSLAALLHSILRDKTMSVPEMAEAAKKAGHKTRSKKFRVVVGLALHNHRNMFKRVARGQYTAK